MKINPTYFKEVEFSIDKLFSFFFNNKSSIFFLHKNILEYCIKLTEYDYKNVNGMYENYLFKKGRSFVISSRQGEWHLLEMYKSNDNLVNNLENAKDVYFLKLEK